MGNNIKTIVKKEENTRRQKARDPTEERDKDSLQDEREGRSQAQHNQPRREQSGSSDPCPENSPPARLPALAPSFSHEDRTPRTLVCAYLMAC